MEFIVNGKEEKIGSGATIRSYLNDKNISFDSVVVELNREIIDKSDYGTTQIRDKDILEILRFVGGG